MDCYEWMRCKSNPSSAHKLIHGTDDFNAVFRHLHQIHHKTRDRWTSTYSKKGPEEITWRLVWHAKEGVTVAGGLGRGPRLRREGLLHWSHQSSDKLDRPKRQVSSPHTHTARNARAVTTVALPGWCVFVSDGTFAKCTLFSLSLSVFYMIPLFLPLSFIAFIPLFISPPAISFSAISFVWVCLHWCLLVREDPWFVIFCDEVIPK